jgi:hypothetical protein
MPRPIAALALLLFTLPAVARDDGVEWKEVKPKDGKFTFSVPKENCKEDARREQSPFGPANAYAWGASTGKTEFMVTLLVLRQGTLRGADLQKSLDSVRNRSLAVLNATVTDEKKITIGTRKYPGRDIRAEAAVGGGPKMGLRVRYYIVQERLYSLMALFPAGTEAEVEKDVEKYLNSFSIKE